MLRVTYSDRFELLVQELADALQDDDASRLGSLFSPPGIVVPNQQVATFARRAIARRHGIAANLNFPFLDSFLARCGETPTVRVLDRNRLQGLLTSCLNHDGLLAKTHMEPVLRYVSEGVADSSGRELRVFQLAHRVAALFMEYTVSRPELVGGWTSDPPQFTLHSTTERWQAELWSAVFGKGGATERIESETGVRWVTLPNLFRAVPAQQWTCPKRAILLGFSYFARGYQQLFARLGRMMDLHILLLNPCNQFWEDIGDDPSDNRALQLWGRPGRDATRALNELCDSNFDDRFGPADLGDTLLGRVQDHIRSRTVPEEPIPEGTNPADDSLRIFACPTIRRELEIIGNEIWRLMAADSTLAFNDIAVLLCRGQEANYEAQVATVFGELHGLPHQLADVPLTRQSRMVEAFELLLALPLGEFARPELLRLCTHPNVIARFPNVDAGDWIDWSVALGIVHGADQSDHTHMYIEGDHYNWDQGIRRLALGAFMAGAPSGETRAMQFGNSRYLPEELAPEATPSAARFALLIRSLIADARACRHGRMSMTDWATFLDVLASTYLIATSPADERNLSLCRESIASLRTADLDARAVGYRTACEFVRANLQQLRGSTGEFLSGGVVVAPLRPMRTLPFRVVFIAGLGEGDFPAREPRDYLDLRDAAPRHDDITGRDRDRYLFLETLLSARDKLRLSYVARNEQSGETREPSSVVLELLQILADQYVPPKRARQLVLEHPLRRYDASYFTNSDSELRTSVSPAAARQARAHQLRVDLDAHIQTHNLPGIAIAQLREHMTADSYARLADLLSLPTPPRRHPPQPTGTIEKTGSLSAPMPAKQVDTVHVSLSMVRRFLESPLQAWASLILGLHPTDGEDPVAQQDEPFASDFPTTVGLLRDVFADYLSQADSQANRAGLERAYQLRANHLELSGKVPTGVFSRLEKADHLRVLHSWLDHLREIAGSSAETRWQTVCFGRAREHQSVDTLHPPIHIPVVHQSADGRTTTIPVELYGHTELIGTPAVGSMVLAPGGRPQPKHLLRGIVDQLALAAAGLHADRPHQVSIATRSAQRQQHQLEALSRSQAQQRLGLLLGELMHAPHAYLLPCEAVFEYLSKPVEPAHAVVQRFVMNESSRFSCRYGPIDDLSHLAAPEDAEAMIQRRFGSLLPAMGGESNDGG